MKLTRLCILLAAANYNCFSMIIDSSDRALHSQSGDDVHNVKADIETWRSYLDEAWRSYFDSDRKGDPLGRVNPDDAKNCIQRWHERYTRAIAELNEIAGCSNKYRRKAREIRSETARDALLFAAQCPVLSRKQVSNIYAHSGFTQKRSVRWPQEERQKARLYMIAALRAELREWDVDDLTTCQYECIDTRSRRAIQQNTHVYTQSLSYSQFVDDTLGQYAHPYVALQPFPHIPCRYFTHGGYGTNTQPRYMATPQQLMSKIRRENNSEVACCFYERVQRIPYFNAILRSQLY